MADAQMPERIWATPEEAELLQPEEGFNPTEQGMTEYLRRDLCASGQQVRALVEALRPFASEADMWGDLVPDDHAPLCVEMGHTDGRYYGSATKYTVGDLRRARTALTPAPQPEGQVRALDVDDLAQIIRVVDGNNTLGAGELAEAILEAMPVPRIVGSLTPVPQAEAQVREAAHRILELYDEALRWLLDPGVHDAHPDSKEMAELRRIVGAPAHRWTPSPDAPQTLTADQWRNGPARFAAHGITAAPDAATPTATDDPVKPWRMAFEAAARMAEQGILSMDGGQAATEIRSLAPDRVPATPTAQEAVPVAWIGRSGMIVDEPLRGFTPLYTHPPQPSEAVADQIIGQIEDRFPNWRSYRDLLDCIDCTLHDLRTLYAATPTAQEAVPVEWRARRSESEEWQHFTRRPSWWEVQALYAHPPQPSVPTDNPDIARLWVETANNDEFCKKLGVTPIRDTSTGDAIMWRNNEGDYSNFAHVIEDAMRALKGESDG